jgi:putative FmdB family regulatory protein
VPTYDYQCRACGTVTEVIHSMLEDGPSVCELCGGRLRRVLYPSGIIFKGSGFYRNDSRPSRSSSGSESETGAGSTDKAGASEGGAGKGSEGSTGSTTADGGSSAKKATSTDGSSS